jgi:hypothetical protein
MERKNLPVTTKKRSFDDNNVLYVRPSDVKNVHPNFADSKELEELKIKGKLKTLDKQNIGKGIEAFNNVIGLAQQIAEIIAQKSHSEAKLKELDKKMELIDKEAEKFIKEERESRDTIIIENKFISEMIDKLIHVANNDSLSDEIKAKTIEAISKAASK